MLDTLISQFLPLFLAGLFGGVHCIGMCGGFVAALCSGTVTKQNSRSLAIAIAYNLGRITTYCSLALFISLLLINHSAKDLPIATATLLQRLNDWRWWLAVVAQIALLAMAFYLAGFPQILMPVEKIVNKIWQRIQPLSRKFLPLQTLPDAYIVGLIWGFLPCGLVYAALIHALAAPTPLTATLKMLAFALGTLPNLLFASFALQRAQKYLRPLILKRIFAMIIASFAIVALSRLFS